MATIDTNMSLVMIDPNEPLELYDGTIIKGRLEWFLYALCCLDYGNLPTPLSRIEEWANALITNELPNMEPQSRAEEFFKAILTGDTSNLPTPQSRSEVLLDKLARGENDFTNVEKIQSRYEFLLAYLIKNGGGIGNIDYVLYKFQKEDETLYNTKERPVKSAILKGQTLVNILTKPITNHTFTTGSGSTQNVTQLQANKKYIAFIDIANVTNEATGIYIRIHDTYQNGNSVVLPIKDEKFTIGLHKLIFTMPSSSYSEFEIMMGFVRNAEATVTYNYAMILEYQDGMENWDIPYFEGMSSVKMPVLTTTGKNLVGKLMYGSVSTGGNIVDNMNQKRVRTDFINIQNEEKITIKTHSEEVNQNISFFYDENKKFISQTSWNPSITNSNGLTILIPSNAKYVICEFTHNLPSDKDLVLSNIKVQIEKGDTATFYESFKSNILSTPEDLVLRGIGEARDELNLLTGEKISKLEQLTVTNNTNWLTQTSSHSDCYSFYYNPQIGKSDGLLICDNLPSINSLSIGEGCRITGTGRININILKSKLNDSSLNSLNDYLAINPLTFIYELPNASIKTVDLSIVDQGGATIPKLKTFDKITHVNVSATDILPGVEMEVATTIGEDLSGTLYSTMEDIETKQEALKESNNAQTESINSTMMATTEIYESLL